MLKKIVALAPLPPLSGTAAMAQTGAAPATPAAPARPAMETAATRDPAATTAPTAGKKAAKEAAKHRKRPQRMLGGCTARQAGRRLLNLLSECRATPAAKRMPRASQHSMVPLATCLARPTRCSTAAFNSSSLRSALIQRHRATYPQWHA